MSSVSVIGEERILQGDIIRDVEYIESASEEAGVITITKVVFPLVIVLTQDCDLVWDYVARKGTANSNDKNLLSIIIAPLYNYEQLKQGTHLMELGLQMRKFHSDPKKTENKLLCQNETPRYHFIEFDETFPVVNQVVDFKHYFTVNLEYLQTLKNSNYVCSVNPLYRERISQRFANYLARIGLPEAQPQIFV